MQINPNCSVQDWKYNKYSLVLGSIEKHDLEHQLSSTRGTKGDLADIFRSAKDGEGYLFSSPSFLVKYFLHFQSASSHVKKNHNFKYILTNWKKPTTNGNIFKIKTLMSHAP